MPPESKEKKEYLGNTYFNCIKQPDNEFRLSALSPSIKGALWGKIKTKYPDIATVMSTDENLKLLKEYYDSDYILTQKQIDKVMR